MKLYFIFCISFISCIVNAQTMRNLPSDEEVNAYNPLSIILGFGFTQWTGGEIPKPVPGFGYHFGIAYEAKKAMKKKIGLNLEIQGKLSKFNFNNGNLGTSGITRITVLQVEVPILGVKNLNSKGKNQLLFGLSPSYILSSSASLGPDKIPIEKGVYLTAFKKLPLVNIPLYAIVGYQIVSTSFIWKTELKYTINDLNNNFEIASGLPQTGKGKPIRWLELRTSFLF